MPRKTWFDIGPGMVVCSSILIGDQAWRRAIMSCVGMEHGRQPFGDVDDTSYFVPVEVIVRTGPMVAIVGLVYETDDGMRIETDLLGARIPFAMDVIEYRKIGSVDFSEFAEGTLLGGAS